VGRIVVARDVGVGGEKGLRITKDKAMGIGGTAGDPVDEKIPIGEFVRSADLLNPVEPCFSNAVKLGIQLPFSRLVKTLNGDTGR
jgi:hypothetical protein